MPVMHPTQLFNYRLQLRLVTCNEDFRQSVNPNHNAPNAATTPAEIARGGEDASVAEDVKTEIVQNTQSEVVAARDDDDDERMAMHALQGLDTETDSQNIRDLRVSIVCSLHNGRYN